MQNVKTYVEEHKQRFLNELIELLKIPSVSADTAFSQDMVNMAKAVENALIEAGCDLVEICETDGYPIVYAEKIVDSNFCPTSIHLESLCLLPNQSSIILIDNKNDEGFAIFCPAMSNAAP